MADLATRLKAARTARRLTAAQLVEELAALGERRTPSYIYQLESGAQDNPTLGVLRALATSLRVSLGWLVGEDLYDHAAELSNASIELDAGLSTMARDVTAMVARATQLAHDSNSIARQVEGLAASGRAMISHADLVASKPMLNPPSPELKPPPLSNDQRTVLAGRLYSLRLAARLEIGQVERALRRRRLNLAAIEQAEATVHPQVVDELLTHYGIGDPRERVCVLSIASGEREPAWYDRPTVPLRLNAGYYMEDRATHIWNFQLQYMPTLLQIEDYALAACRAAISPNTREEFMAAALSFAKSRQEILERPSPPAVWTLLDECVFFRPIGTLEVRLRQIDALIKAAKRPNISIQIIPFSPAAHPFVGSAIYVPRTGPFTLWRMPGSEPDAVALHCFTTDRLLDTPEVDDYKAAFNWAAVTATQPGRDTLDLLQHHRTRLQRELD